MPGLTRPPQTAYVVVATCSGCARLSETAGHRIALIFVATDPAAELARLRRRAHGGWLLQDSIDAPFLLEPGWHDWTAVDLDIAMTRGAILPEGPCIKAGRLRVQLCAPASIGAFGRRLGLLLEHLRFDDALLSRQSIAGRMRSGLPLVVEPRFSAETRRDVATCERVRNLYLFDPWTMLNMLVTCAAAASVGEDIGAAP